MDTVHGLFELNTKINPQHIAIVDGSNSLTYESLNHRANQFAHYLLSYGVKKESLIAVFIDRSIDFLVAILGILKAGAAYIPLDLNYPQERISLILKDANNPILVLSKGYRDKFIAYTGKIIEMPGNKFIKAQSIYNPLVDIGAKNLAYVIYTSGTTGVPKGVLIEHRAIINYITWFSQQCPNITRVDFSANHAFDMAITSYLAPLTLGLTIVICADNIKKDPSQYIKYLKKYSIDFIKLTPSYFKVLVNITKNKSIKLPDLKKIMLGGEQLSKVECAQWLSLYPEHILYNEYGPTEATVAMACFAVHKANIDTLSETIPIGVAANNTYAYILDKNLQPVNDGEEGELYIGGVCLARSYLNSQKLTDTFFINDPFSKFPNTRLYKTGDLCRYFDKSILECLGRIDHQIKIRGFRVEIGEVEYYLSSHPDIKAVAVIATHNDKKESILVAYYVLKNSAKQLLNNDISSYLRKYLPDYMIPLAFIAMDVLPLNANDKLDRNALPEPNFNNRQNYKPPITNMEKTLAQIWSQELGIKKIGINDDFFELGGHSLSAAHIITKINHEFKKDISLQDFYANPSISQLMPVIQQHQKHIKKQNQLSRVFNSEAGVFPLSDFQFMLWVSNIFEPKANKLNICSRKRVQGCLDINVLNKALVILLQKHEALSYHICKFSPKQYFRKISVLNIMEESLEELANIQKEEFLEKSIYTLMCHTSWKKNYPNIIIKLFRLSSTSSELQLCIPHILADDLSPDILLCDLSKFYNNSFESDNKIQDSLYRNYLLDEHIYLSKYIDRDIRFWDNYLQDASLYAFPQEYVVYNMQLSNYSYSTYIELPEKNLKNLASFCAKNHVSILDGLCALLIRALKNSAPNKDNAIICINRVKSTRDNRAYDNTIGCFLRIEPIKLMLNEDSDMSVISQKIHQEAIFTTPYQGCPNLIKLASLKTFRKEKKLIKETFLKTFFWIYSIIFKTQIYYKTLRILSRLNNFKGNNFLININVQNNFLHNSQEHKSEQFFGLPEQNIPTHEYDFLNIDNVFDASFLRLPYINNPLLVISANIHPDYRKKIGAEMIRIMSEELLIAVS